VLPLQEWFSLTTPCCSRVRHIAGLQPTADSQAAMRVANIGAIAQRRIAAFFDKVCASNDCGSQQQDDLVWIPPHASCVPQITNGDIGVTVAYEQSVLLASKRRFHSKGLHIWQPNGACFKVTLYIRTMQDGFHCT